MLFLNCINRCLRQAIQHKCKNLKCNVIIQKILDVQKNFHRSKCNTKRNKNKGGKTTTSGTKSGKKLVAMEEVIRFIKDCFIASCVPEDHACIMAKTLAACDYRGIMSHGMNRVEMYINMLKTNALDGCVKPVIKCETPATAWVDGKNGLGAVIAHFCMELAMGKAEEVGIGFVVAQHSNHYIVPGLYNLKAMEKGYIGINMSNTWPLMAPKGAKEPILGTNPISIGAPGADDHYLFDVATTQVAVGKLEVASRKGPTIPAGWALDKDGKPTTDVKKALEAKLLLPLGGIDFGYKGYGLAGAIDILTGVLGDSDFSKNIVFKEGVPMNLGQNFLVINPNMFAPDFKERLTCFNQTLRSCKVDNEKNKLMIPGDTEIQRMKEVVKAGGIEYTENQLQACEKLSKELDVEPLQFVC
ncbi:uncharacterized oxidoreductase YjmC-like [Teleopsis dalmanni]|uniref:uncharacterized oxidoreductase YjmC-like n=1 Tax=Teleopsis dalmanni TaxID=139649 RepID=UPI0018CD75BB|nr:uncharacterized oxidoreductase YjmC-like [Teleopsis dalmanni]